MPAGDMQHALHLARLRVEIAVLTCDAVRRVLLHRRQEAPFRDSLALPGTPLDLDETFHTAARRLLREATGVPLDALRPIGVYDAPDRGTAGMRVVSLAYVVELTSERHAAGDGDVRRALWVPVGEALAGTDPLAFDHGRILHDAVALVGEVR